MPIYEYTCRECRKITEVFSYDEIPVCECGKQMERIMSVVNSNFSAWSDTIKREMQWASKPHEETMNG